jgi:hypothetical protein
VAEHGDLSGIGEEDRHEHPDAGGLPGAVRTDETAQAAAISFLDAKSVMGWGVKAGDKLF